VSLKSKKVNEQSGRRNVRIEIYNLRHEAIWGEPIDFTISLCLTVMIFLSISSLFLGRG